MTHHTTRRRACRCSVKETPPQQTSRAFTSAIVSRPPLLSGLQTRAHGARRQLGILTVLWTAHFSSSSSSSSGNHGSTAAAYPRVAAAAAGRHARRTRRTRHAQRSAPAAATAPRAQGRVWDEDVRYPRLSGGARRRGAFVWRISPLRERRDTPFDPATAGTTNSPC